MSLSLRMLIGELEGQDPVLGVLMIGAGLVFVILGARIFRVLMAISLGCVGLVLGASLPLDPFWQMLAGVAGGIGLALASVFLVRLGVAALAGGWFAAAAMLVAGHLQARDDIVLIIGGLAFLAIAALTFVLYFEVIAAVMSFEGALLILAGLAICLSRYSAMWYHIRALLLETPALAAFLVLAGTVAGYYTQIAERQKKQVGISG